MTVKASLVDLPLSAIKGLGPASERKLAKLGIHSVWGLLLHCPSRYEDRREITAIQDCMPGGTYQIKGRVVKVTIRGGKRRALIVQVADDSAVAVCQFFYFHPTQVQQYRDPEREWVIYGQCRQGRASGVLQWTHPEMSSQLPASIRPIYALVQGVQQRQLQLWITRALSQYANLLRAEHLVLAPYVKGVEQACLWSVLQAIHQPTEADCAALQAGTHPAQLGLIVDELAAHRLFYRGMEQRSQQAGGVPVRVSMEDRVRFTQQLPYVLTEAQNRVIDEIVCDYASGRVMNRLVQGDVGCGKTVVAALAALPVLRQGGQVVVMAPTELLARQHHQSWQAWFANWSIPVIFLSGQLSVKQKRAVYQALSTDAPMVVIGTHAVFQQTCHFACLQLVIIDEQQRFGVAQRQELLAKADTMPHYLALSATPIPRSLALMLYAELDCSVIDQRPAHCQPIQTTLLSEQRREQLIDRVRHWIQSGHQVYWVCPLIDESEEIAAQSAVDTFEALKDCCPTLSIGLVHGRLSAEEKHQAMQAFSRGETELLVATTVIEVGVDVPRASLMVIENAERLGLAQLHQLRGRVGRGEAASHCVLLHSDALSDQAKQRLRIMKTSVDGFYIAEQDLALRGPGDLLGVRQSGELLFKVAALPRDAGWVAAVVQAADQLNTMEIDQLHQRWLGGQLACEFVQ